jgi:hypothetical protein
VKKIVAILAVAAGLMSVAAGGTGIAIGTSHPQYGKQLFVMLEGSQPKKSTTTYTISMDCVQNGVPVLSDAGSSEGYGHWFQMGPTPQWSGGDATCTSELRQPARNSYKVLDRIVFTAYGS